MNKKCFIRSLIYIITFFGLLNTQILYSQSNYLFNDSHFHLTNYIQEGITVQDYLKIMDNKVGRSTLFGIPVQQMWSYGNSGEYAPTYYLQSDAPLYYYSFTDAFIAMQYKSLSATDQKRFDPMITGFNPADMYAAEHIKRVLETFPGVFSGIGEFSIHKEFVSSKIAGGVASLTNPALDSILNFCAEVGLVVILHSDMDMPMAKKGTDPVYLNQMKELFRRNPNTTIIWAHVGLGRIVYPAGYGSSNNPERSTKHLDIVEEILKDPAFKNVYFDISWDEVAKYIVSSPQAIKNTAEVMEEFPDRFLFGTDVVAPPTQDFYLGVYNMYQPLWDMLSKNTKEKLLLSNYERIFDKARADVRAWEKENVLMNK
ncbi:MAG: amidohydrolase family protein [Bacteroidetes bacterium]|nr:amidohydrolase family protein [Bacteroidota bacterium]MBP7398670.1 amidohydrolase family protein [Chitinophagales bacterium]MBK7109929.1 amidohydrolase family protein [Bacteroidota bacterium]MBK8487343.1 amidohydrolase family protein [Bacteroidota bacterium]MBK8682916.1 amidohydrolase family protein [Bacteroidota bacterium]